MPDFPHRVVLTDFESGKEVDAHLIELLRFDARTKIDAVWWRELGVERHVITQERDSHWEWARIVRQYRHNPAAYAIAVQTDDQAIQGAMLYRVDGISELLPGSNAVEIEFYATAPRNREEIRDPPLYRGVGKALLRFAIEHAFEVGLDGRLILCSLPSPKTTTFYKNRGFQETGNTKDDMVRYELPTSSAARLLVGW